MIDENQLFLDAERAFQVGRDDHLKALMEDQDNPYYQRDPVDVETLRMKKIHKIELIRQAVNFRVPPPVDKKSLSAKYASLSQRDMKNILGVGKESPATPVSKIKLRDHRADLEREIAEMEMEMEERNERLAQQALHAGADSEESSKYRSLGASARLDDEYLPAEADGDTAMEFDEFFALYDSDSNNNSEVESPYTRTKSQKRKKKKGSGSKHAGAKSKGDPSSATYHDRHGSAGLAELMAPLPVSNPSKKYLRDYSSKRNDRDRELYLTVLDEATLMQQKFVQCVAEANLFSKELGKGDVYKVVERDAVEDAAWNHILDNRGDTALTTRAGRRAAKLRIPRGTGQRIAKALVEVTHPMKDVRYLGTDHFFREHGRLQHAVQRKVSVEHSSHRLDRYPAEAAEGGNEEKDVSSPRKNTRGAHAESPTSPEKILPLKHERISSNSDTTRGGGTDPKEEQAAGSPSKLTSEKMSHMQYRKEIQAKLQRILGIIVKRTRKIQSQTEFIQASGWNWMG